MLRQFQKYDPNLQGILGKYGHGITCFVAEEFYVKVLFCSGKALPWPMFLKINNYEHSVLKGPHIKLNVSGTTQF